MKWFLLKYIFHFSLQFIFYHYSLKFHIILKTRLKVWYCCCLKKLILTLELLTHWTMTTSRTTTVNLLFPFVLSLPTVFSNKPDCLFNRTANIIYIDLHYQSASFPPRHRHHSYRVRKLTKGKQIWRCPSLDEMDGFRESGPVIACRCHHQYFQRNAVENEQLRSSE